MRGGDTRFKPGNKMAVGHRAPSGLPPEIRVERKRNQAALIKLVATHFNLSHEEAQSRMDDPAVSRIEMAIFKLVENCTNLGDIQTFKYLMELMVGKIPETDSDDFDEEDLRLLKRIKELKSAKPEP